MEQDVLMGGFLAGPSPFIDAGIDVVMEDLID
jgi:hypothetical protein